MLPERLPGRVRPVDVGSSLGRFERFEIREELGAGGMATVYRARDRELRREVAVKVLFPHLCKRREVVARFQREARAAASLDHPNIVRVYDVGGDTEPASGRDAAEPPYIVMELVRGHSLQEVFEAQAARPLAEVVACVGVILCAALAEAHGKGIIHRDVKPANILVTDTGRLALADFGVARVHDEDASLVTRTGALLGTPAFMSPEQALADDLDARSDIYSLGATLYWLATGATPFSGSTAKVVTAIVSSEATPMLKRNPAIGKELGRVVDRMMAKDPNHRYQSAGDAARALGEIAALAGLGEPADELQAFFRDPAAYRADREPRVVARLVARARAAAAERSANLTMALADRIMALVPHGPEAAEAMKLVESLGRSRRGRRLVMAGVAVALVTAGFTAAAWRGAWQGQAGHASMVMADAAPADASGSDAALARAALLDASEADTRLAIDMGDTGRAVPAGAGSAVSTGPGNSTSSQTPGQRAAPDRSSAAARPDRTRVPARAPVDAGPDLGSPGPDPGPEVRPTALPIDAAVAAVEAGQARLVLDIRPWCDVRIDGKDHGRVNRDRAIALDPGKHEVVCTQGPGRAEWRQTVTLEPGQRLALQGNVLGSVRVTIAVKTGDRVLIQGASHKNGTSLTLLPGRYRMDVMAGSTRAQGAWVSVPALTACTVRDQPALDCYP